MTHTIERTVDAKAGLGSVELCFNKNMLILGRG